MKSLSKKEMINYILETVKSNNITVYSISKGTNITQSAIANIINRTTKNPHAINVKTLYDYLVDKYGEEEKQIENNPEIHKVEDDQSKGKKIELYESDLDRILNLKIERIVQQLTDDKFKEINESLLFLLRKSLDIDIKNTDNLKNIIGKAD
jgi:transcriptional regulator with XRE-family HTH domain